jgi:hypothetical protein
MRQNEGMIERVMPIVKSLKAKDPSKVQFINLDNAGKSLMLKAHLDKKVSE